MPLAAALVGKKPAAAACGAGKTQASTAAIKKHQHQQQKQHQHQHPHQHQHQQLKQHQYQQQNQQNTAAASSPRIRGSKWAAPCESAAMAVSGGDGCFTARQQKKLKDAFDFFDIDNDGKITCGELQKVLRFLGTKVNEEEVKMMISDVDINRNGTVEFNEFLRMMRSYHHRHCGGHSEDADMWEAFKAFDHNGDNYIDFTEIKKTMQFLGEEVSDEDVQSMIREADIDNDGKINFEEFKKMMAVLHHRAEGSK